MVIKMDSNTDNGFASDSAKELIRAVNVAIKAFIEDVTKSE